MREVALSELRKDSRIQPFRRIPEVFKAIRESMAEDGWDQAEPLVAWNGLIVDGNTRFDAAVSAGLTKAWVVDREFPDVLSAFDYAVKRQRERRNLTSAEILNAVKVRDKLKPAGRKPESASEDANSNGKSAAETAAVLGVSQATVERARTVLADPDAAAAVEAGEKTITGAATEIRERKKVEAAAATGAEPKPSAPALIPADEWPESSQPGMYTVSEWNALGARDRDWLLQEAPLRGDKAFNRQDKDNDGIDWAWWSWNPVTGCKHNCPYCYARDITTRFTPVYKHGFEPVFLPGRLHDPRRTKVRAKDAEKDPRERNVFTCSMADLFGNWVPQEWIDAVFAEIVENPQWNFLCLTKFPQRLAELEWPENAWCGTTVDRQFRVAIAERAFKNVQAGVKWLSCEPLLERLTFESLDMFDLVAVGGASPSNETPAFQPPNEWIDHLFMQARQSGTRFYIKSNAKYWCKELPGFRLPDQPAPTAFDLRREPAG